MMTSL